MKRAKAYKNCCMAVLNGIGYYIVLVMFVSCTKLTHLDRDKMAAKFLTTISNAYSWMKLYKFRLRFHWNLFPRVKITIFQHWFRWWLGAGQATSHYLNQWWLVYWRIYALPLATLLTLNELKCTTGYLQSSYQLIPSMENPWKSKNFSSSKNALQERRSEIHSWPKWW